MTKTQRNKLDRLWQQAIHARGRACIICGKANALNGHHIFSRTRMSTRYDLDNGCLLCPGCHVHSSLLSAHKAPRAFFKRLEDIKGKEWLNTLERKSNETAKNLNYEEIKEYLENNINQ